MEVVERQFGSPERDLVQSLLQLGHAQVHDLSHAFASRNPRTNGKSNGNHLLSEGKIVTEKDLLLVLARLIQADIVEIARPASFRNPVDVYHEIEQDVMKPAPGEKVTKQKVEHQHMIEKLWRSYRDQGQSVKRQLDQSRGSAGKRRKLQNGKVANGDNSVESVPQLDVSIIQLSSDVCLLNCALTMS